MPTSYVEWKLKQKFKLYNEDADTNFHKIVSTKTLLMFMRNSIVAKFCFVTNGNKFFLRIICAYLDIGWFKNTVLWQKIFIMVLEGGVCNCNRYNVYNNVLEFRLHLWLTMFGASRWFVCHFYINVNVAVSFLCFLLKHTNMVWLICLSSFQVF